MTRSRTVREGSVGLLALLGLFLFGGLIIWLRGVNFGKDSYNIVAEFPDVYGVQIGGAVRYRGVQIGRVIGIEPASNGVAITMEITAANLRIPRQVKISTNRSGLIGESFIDIVPVAPLPASAVSMSPIGSECDKSQIVCEGDRLQGEASVTFEQLLPSLMKLADLYGDPKFLSNLSSTLENTSKAALEASKLSKELTLLSTSFRQEVKLLSGSANSLFRSADLTTNQIRGLTDNINTLVGENRSNLGRTLNSISQTSEEVRSLVAQLYPTIDRFNSTLSSADTKTLFQNLENFSLNAATASASLRDLSNSLNNPNNLLTLQQTLDSARVTFENTRKITADLDELTGDPSFRTNLRKLVDGLGKLVSLEEQLEQQVQASQALADEGKQDLYFSALRFSPVVYAPSSTSDVFLSDNLNKGSVSNQNPQTSLPLKFGD